jgi:hypothetical protein
MSAPLPSRFPSPMTNTGPSGSLLTPSENNENYDPKDESDAMDAVDAIDEPTPAPSPNDRGSATPSSKAPCVSDKVTTSARMSTSPYPSPKTLRENQDVENSSSVNRMVVKKKKNTQTSVSEGPASYALVLRKMNATAPRAGPSRHNEENNRQSPAPPSSTDVPTAAANNPSKDATFRLMMAWDKIPPSTESLAPQTPSRRPNYPLAPHPHKPAPKYLNPPQTIRLWRTWRSFFPPVSISRPSPKVVTQRYTASLLGKYGNMSYRLVVPCGRKLQISKPSST